LPLLGTEVKAFAARGETRSIRDGRSSTDLEVIRK